MQVQAKWGDQLIRRAVAGSQEPSVGTWYPGQGEDAGAESSAFPHADPRLFIFLKLVSQLNKY